jgi:hypothetical protein
MVKQRGKKMIKIFTIVQMQICFVAFFLLPCPYCVAFMFAPPWVTDSFRPDPCYFDLPVGFLGVLSLCFMLVVCFYLPVSGQVMEQAGFITMAQEQFASNLPRKELPKKPKQNTFMGNTIMAVKLMHIPCPCMS